jgi:hypothetical protein
VPGVVLVARDRAIARDRDPQAGKEDPLDRPEEDKAAFSDVLDGLLEGSNLSGSKGLVTVLL